MIFALADTRISDDDLYGRADALAQRLCAEAGVSFEKVYTDTERAQGLQLWAQWVQPEAGDSLRDVLEGAERLIKLDIQAFKAGIEAPF